MKTGGVDIGIKVIWIFEREVEEKINLVIVVDGVEDLINTCVVNTVGFSPWICLDGDGDNPILLASSASIFLLSSARYLVKDSSCSFNL